MFIIFACFILSTLSAEIHPFRYKNGSITTTKGSANVSGTVIVQNATTGFMIEYYGMDISTMTPFMIQAFAAGTVKQDLEIELECVEGKWSNGNTVKMTGNFIFSGDWDKAIVTANCKIMETDESWVVNSREMEKKGIYSSYEEAATNARLLIGQSSDKYTTSDVISYAILGYPYSNLNCEIIANKFPDANAASPGIIIVGTDKKHCGIIDNEGNKFVHSDSTKKIVSDASLTLAKKYFPNGHIYKSYPMKY